MKVALIQENLVWENKTANLHLFEQRLDDCADASLILLPEMFSTGFSMNSEILAESMNETTVQWLKESAVKSRALIMGSAIIRENNHYYNRLLAAKPDGTIETYDKKHLFTMGNEPNHYSPGNEALIVKHQNIAIKAIVCYDLRFPEWCRNTEQYDVLVCVANWPEVRSYPWRQLLIARAIENQCYVLAVNRVGMDGNGINHSGNSMIIGPKGEIIQELVHESGVLQANLDFNYLQEFRSQFPVLNDRDQFKFI